MPAGRHPGHHVIINMAMQQPIASRTGGHINRIHAGGQYFDHVGPSSMIKHGLAVPMHSMVIHLIAQCDKMPAHMIADTSLIAFKITEQSTVDGVFQAFSLSFSSLKIMNKAVNS
jgi:hypothetical protein